MSINQVNVDEGLPQLYEGEFRIMERKGVNGDFEVRNQNYGEEGILFLTSRRLIFISEGNGVKSFEVEICEIKDGAYVKKGNNRVLQGLALVVNDQNSPCKFVFKYDNTGFRSLISVFFSIYEQMQTNSLYTSTPGLKSKSVHKFK